MPTPVPGFAKSALKVLALLCLALALGAWQDFRGRTINPKFVERIKNGVTTKQEILVMFGDPQETQRTPEGLVFKYVSYQDAPAPMPSKNIYHEPKEQSTSHYFVTEEKKVKKVPVKTKGEKVQSTLIIRFKPDGNTVMSHDYQEVKEAK